MNNCPICHENINDDDEYITECHHCFHYECFQQWKDTDIGDTCPVCRSPIRKMSQEQLQKISDDLTEHIESAHFLLEIFLQNSQQRQKFKDNAFKSILNAMNLSTYHGATSSQFTHIYKLTHQLDNLIRCI